MSNRFFWVLIDIFVGVLIVFLSLEIIFSRPVGFKLIFWGYVLSNLILLFFCIKKRKWIYPFGILFLSGLIWFYYLPSFTIKLAVIKVPKNYEGYICLGFTFKARNQLEIKNKIVYINLLDSQYNVYSVTLLDEIKQVPLFVDAGVKRNIPAVVENGQSQRNYFINRIDTIRFNADLLYVYTLFISQSPYDENDTILQRKFIQYQSQKESLLKKIDEKYKFMR